MIIYTLFLSYLCYVLCVCVCVCACVCVCFPYVSPVTLGIRRGKHLQENMTCMHAYVMNLQSSGGWSHSLRSIQITHTNSIIIHSWWNHHIDAFFGMALRGQQKKMKQFHRITLTYTGGGGWPWVTLDKHDDLDSICLYRASGVCPCLLIFVRPLMILKCHVNDFFRRIPFSFYCDDGSVLYMDV